MYDGLTEATIFLNRVVHISSVHELRCSILSPQSALMVVSSDVWSRHATRSLSHLGKGARCVTRPGRGSALRDETWERERVA